MKHRPAQIVRIACAEAQESAIEVLSTELGDGDFAFIIVLVTHEIDLLEFAQKFGTLWPETQIIGARTAGELCTEGYSQGRIVALAFPNSHFRGDIALFQEIDALDEMEIARKVLSLKQNVKEPSLEFDGENIDSNKFNSEFAFLLVDGLSLREDKLVSYISSALGSTQLFGGSSGDGLRFENAPVLYNGSVYENAAILLFARSACAIKLFREDHLEASEKRLVVTGAIPEERLVTEINGSPAAQEYARIVGIDPNQLTAFTFASHPVVVRAGNRHHVRAIQRVENQSELRFFSSIDEGMVLTVANARSISEHLEAVLEGLWHEAEPDLIFACDCILRRLEAEQKQQIGVMSKLLSAHRVFGFSTYGEQHNMLHINQTLTGIAFYPPNQGIQKVLDE